MANISIRLNQQEEELFKGYAELTGENLSTLFKEALKKSIDDEYDLQVYKEAYKEYQQDPVTISHADFKKELGFWKNTMLNTQKEHKNKSRN